MQSARRQGGESAEPDADQPFSYSYRACQRIIFEVQIRTRTLSTISPWKYARICSENFTPTMRAPNSKFLLNASSVRFALEITTVSSITAVFACSLPGLPA